MTTFRTTATAMALLGTVALSVPASAAPVASSTATLKQAASSDVIQVRSRSGRAAAAAGIGFAAGALIGSAAASSRYYGPYGYYGAPYAYGPGVYAGPGYVGGNYYTAPGYRGYPGCDRVDSSGVTRFDNCY